MNEDLNEDCIISVLEKIAEELDGASILFQIALLNKKVDISSLFDPWKFWLYRRDPLLAKRLINTYILCYNANPSNSKPGRGDEPILKKLCTKKNTQDTYTPRYDYISMAKNLHMPALYQCIERYYEPKEPPNDITDEVRLEINNKFSQLFRKFIDSAHIKECTFHQSTSNDNDAYPVTLQDLNELIIAKGTILRYLNLGFFKCNDKGLEVLTKGCTALETFKIKVSDCSDRALANFLRASRELKKLKIRDADGMKETVDAIKTQSHSLVKLRILNCNLENCTMAFTGIGECTRLRSLYMRKIRFTTNTSLLSRLLMPIARCEFHNIDFTETQLPVDVLIEIAKKSSTTLRRVHLIRPDKPDNGTAYINLSSGIKALAQHATNLRHFERNIHPLEVDSICYFLDMIGQSLETLLIDSNMDEHDMSKLIEKIGRKCPNLSILNISYFEFSLDAFESLVNGCSLLHTLIINFSESVNDRILELLNRANALQSLEILGCPNISYEAIDRFQKEREIEVEYQ
ncbi:16854_t:CDS:2 [Cetraspora pellucida]|uniref:16854_t:CDS:1 n=1 Tax=Cetraspora pellucida TaxID=1433469 RepID=A0ACA9M889_9GLOM|nr:16854_t:CDS:2 [Cetraspora pellucida]